MFTILTRTSNRPRYFVRCRQSVLDQAEPVYHIVSTDDPADTYPNGDYVLPIDRAEGRGHNLYFNAMRYFSPPDHPWIIHLDDDDIFTRPDALTIIRENIRSPDDFVLWRVDMGDGRVLPPVIGQPPVFGQITGVGFAVHRRHWYDWNGRPGGDFQVIRHYYEHLTPVWIPHILTKCLQIGGGKRMDEIL